MKGSEFLSLISRKKQTIFSIMVLFLLLVMVLTFVQPFRFRSESRLLVVQSAGQGIDPYQVNKANEYIAEVLSKVVPTNSFFSQVLNSGFNIDRGYFPDDPKKMLKKWQDTVFARPSTKGGIITVSVLHTDKNQADQIIRAVNQVMEAGHGAYHGNAEAVSIRVIDQPFTSELPVKPNVPLNVGLAFAFGLIFALSYIYIFPEEAYDLRLLPRRKKRYRYDEEAIRQVNEALSLLKKKGINPGRGQAPEELPIAGRDSRFVRETEESANGSAYQDDNSRQPENRQEEEMDLDAIMRKGNIKNIIREK